MSAVDLSVMNRSKLTPATGIHDENFANLVKTRDQRTQVSGFPYLVSHCCHIIPFASMGDNVSLFYFLLIFPTDFMLIAVCETHLPDSSKSTHVEYCKSLNKRDSRNR